MTKPLNSWSINNSCLSFLISIILLLRGSGVVPYEAHNLCDVSSILTCASKFLLTFETIHDMVDKSSGVYYCAESHPT